MDAGTNGLGRIGNGPTNSLTQVAKCILKVKQVKLETCLSLPGRVDEDNAEDDEIQAETTRLKN